MKLLWDFPKDLQPKLVEGCLSKYGSLLGELSTPHSSIFTFDLGDRHSPRHIVAKGIRVSDSMPLNEKRKYLSRALYEVNNAYAVCHHPSIQRFFDVEVVYGVPFLLSRKRDATLRDVIAEGAVPEAELISIAVQIVHGLNYCARRGLVCHQDLKPENVFVDFISDHFEVPPDYPLRCRVFVADFELANAYLILRHPYGSRPYMAPEQYSRHTGGASTPDFSRVDVFALGVIMYEMLTGGVHPIGEHVSLIWPTPAEGKGRKWLREEPWRQWLNRGAELPTTDGAMDAEPVEIIRDCLKTDSSARLSKDELEGRLLARLMDINKDAYEALTMMLGQFDQLACEGEEGGWPYYAQRLEQLNQAFSEDAP